MLSRAARFSARTRPRLFDRRQERLIEVALCAFELRHLIETAALELHSGCLVQRTVSHWALGVRDRRDEVVGQRAVEASVDHSIGRGLIGAAAGDQHLGQVDYHYVLFLPTRTRGLSKLRLDRTTQAAA